MPQPAGQAHAREHLTGRSDVDGSAGKCAGEDDALLEVQEIGQVLSLEDQADARTADRVSSRLVDQREVDPVDDHAAAGWAVHARDQVQQGRFARPRPAHQRDVVATRDRQVYAAQGPRFDITFAIDPDDVLELDCRAVSRRRFVGRSALGHDHLKLVIIWRKASTLSTPSGVDRLMMARPGPDT